MITFLIPGIFPGIRFNFFKKKEQIKKKRAKNK